MSSPASQPSPCRHWMTKGICLYYEDGHCKFAHPIPCRYWTQVGACRRHSCKFSHAKVHQYSEIKKKAASDLAQKLAHVPEMEQGPALDLDTEECKQVSASTPTQTQASVVQEAPSPPKSAKVPCRHWVSKGCCRLHLSGRCKFEHTSKAALPPCLGIKTLAVGHFSTPCSDSRCEFLYIPGHAHTTTHLSPAPSTIPCPTFLSRGWCCTDGCEFLHPLSISKFWYELGRAHPTKDCSMCSDKDFRLHYLGKNLLCG